MGLVTALLTAPLAPVRTVAWVAGRAAAAAEAERTDSDAIRAELRALVHDWERGLLTDEEFDRREDDLLDRLDAASALGGANQKGTQS